MSLSCLLINCTATVNPVPCLANKDGGRDGQCGHGICKNNFCVCEEFWLHETLNATTNAATITVDPCSYKATSKMLIFFMSLFFGMCGIDWCILAAGVNGGMICMGFFKALTFGGLGVWWVYDWAMLAWGTSNAHCIDGWGFPCFDDLSGAGAVSL